MKVVTEFSVFTLKAALPKYQEIATEGKPAEEIEAALGEAFKLEGDKLKHFANALQVAGGKTDGLRRVLVVTFAEGEKVPASAQQVGESYYLLDSFEVARKPAAATEERGGRGGKKGGRSGGRGNDRGGGGGAGGGRGPKKDDKPLGRPVPVAKPAGSAPTEKA